MQLCDYVAMLSDNCFQKTKQQINLNRTQFKGNQNVRLNLITSSEVTESSSRSYLGEGKIFSPFYSATLVSGLYGKYRSPV